MLNKANRLFPFYPMASILKVHVWSATRNANLWMLCWGTVPCELPLTESAWAKWAYSKPLWLKGENAKKKTNPKNNQNQKEKQKKLLLFKKGCFSENKSLNHDQEISSYLAMFFQFQWCYSELFASFLIYQLYFKKHLLFYHLFHTWQIQ